MYENINKTHSEERGMRIAAEAANALAPAELPEIPAAIDALNSGLGYIEHMLSILETRLNPVLRQIAATTSGESKEAARREGTPLGAMLRDQSRAASSLGNRIESLLNRLAL